MKRFTIQLNECPAFKIVVEGETIPETHAHYATNPDYTVTEMDITQQKINEEALGYLASTDWYIIREMDEGTICPADIRTARAEARARIVR